jgi:hypothetical protein
MRDFPEEGKLSSSAEATLYFRGQHPTLRGIISDYDDLLL